MPIEPPTSQEGRPDECPHSGVGPLGPWDEWDEFACGIGEDELRDAFDDIEDDPEPEHGDFWVEPAEDEGQRA